MSRKVNCPSPVINVNLSACICLSVKTRRINTKVTFCISTVNRSENTCPASSSFHQTLVVTVTTWSEFRIRMKIRIRKSSMKIQTTFFLIFYLILLPVKSGTPVVVNLMYLERINLTIWMINMRFWVNWERLWMKLMDLGMIIGMGLRGLKSLFRNTEKKIVTKKILTLLTPFFHFLFLFCRI